MGISADAGEVAPMDVFGAAEGDVDGGGFNGAVVFGKDAGSRVFTGLDWGGGVLVFGR